MKNPKVYQLKEFGETFNIVLGKSNYINNNTIAVIMYLSTPKGKVKELFNDLTKNIGDSNIYANETDIQFVDTNNLPAGIIEWLEENGIAEEINGIYGHSGFCTYPLVKFKQEALAEMFVID